MLKCRPKKGTSLGNLLVLHKEIIYKSGRIVLYMDKDGLEQKTVKYKENVWRVCLLC